MSNIKATLNKKSDISSPCRPTHQADIFQFSFWIGNLSSQTLKPIDRWPKITHWVQVDYSQIINFSSVFVS